MRSAARAGCVQRRWRALGSCGGGSGGGLASRQLAPPPPPFTSVTAGAGIAAGEPSPPTAMACRDRGHAVPRHGGRAVRRGEPRQPLEPHRHLAAEPLVERRFAGDWHRRLLRWRQQLDRQQRRLLALYRRQQRQRRRLRARQQRLGLDLPQRRGLRAGALLHRADVRHRLDQRHAGGTARSTAASPGRCRSRSSRMARRFFNDKGSITADPTDSNYVYAVWDRLDRADHRSELSCQYHQRRLDLAGRAQHLRSGPQQPDHRQPHRGDCPTARSSTSSTRSTASAAAPPPRT